MQLKSIDPFSDEYLRFVESHPLCVYNDPAWIGLYGNNCKVMGLWENNRLVAVFNTYAFRKSILRFFIPPPFSPDCALLMDPAANAADIAQAIRRWIEKESQKSYALFRFNFSYKHTESFATISIGGLKKKMQHTYVLDLGKADEVQSLYAPKRRQQIRRALKDGLHASPVKDMNLIFQLVKQTFARQGKTIDEKFVKKILFEYANSHNSFAFAAFKEQKPLVAYFCICRGKEAFYLLGGFDEDSKHIGAGPLAMNACIEHAKEKGIVHFDFEGSMEPSIEKYFKEFGGEKKLYPCFERSSKMGSMAVKLKKAIKG